MLMASSYALAEYPDKQSAELLPCLNDIRQVSRHIARKVYAQAIKDGVTAEVTSKEIDEAIEQNFWNPDYRSYRRTTAV